MSRDAVRNRLILDTLSDSSTEADREANGANRYGKWPKDRFLNSRPEVAQEVELEKLLLVTSMADYPVPSSELAPMSEPAPNAGVLITR